MEIIREMLVVIRNSEPETLHVIILKVVDNFYLETEKGLYCLVDSKIISGKYKKAEFR